MRTFVGRILLLGALILAAVTDAGAKWWLFGQSENEISTRYLYLNGVSYDELGDKATVYADTLENGLLTIRGKAATSSSLVGAVNVSRDDKATWDKAKRASDGTFEYSFKPETGKTYRLYVKIIDTTGKTNDVDQTRKEILVSDESISSLIKKALDAMAEAYRNEDPRAFMALVSEDFAPDHAALDRAVRRDFQLFDNIDLRLTPASIASAQGGKIFVSLSFRRSLTSAKSNAQLSDSGATEFVFKLENGSPKALSMKNPLIFGLSDAENLAAGGVAPPGNIAVTGDGLPFIPQTGNVPGQTQTGGGQASGGGGGVSAATPGGGTSAVPSGGGGSGGASGGLDLSVTDLEISDSFPDSMKHHQITLVFSPNVSAPFSPAVEEAESFGGPWKQLTGPDVTVFAPGKVRVMSRNIASNPTLLYYRLFLTKSGLTGPPSNVVTWDNR